jgi:hypothetical protein
VGDAKGNLSKQALKYGREPFYFKKYETKQKKLAKFCKSSCISWRNGV